MNPTTGGETQHTARNIAMPKCVCWYQDDCGLMGVAVDNDSESLQVPTMTLNMVHCVALGKKNIIRCVCGTGASGMDGCGYGPLLLLRAGADRTQ